MTLHRTGIKTSKESAHTTESAVKTKIAFKPKCKSQKLGGKKTSAGQKHTVLLLGPSDLGRSFDSLVNVVTTPPLWPTTMTMTSLSLYAGYANHVTSTITAGSRPF